MTKDEALRLALKTLEYAGPSWIEARQPAITAIKEALAQPEQEPVQVSPLEFVEMVMEKEHLISNPIFWAEWPNKEKNT
jgi:hypothetical protein